MSESEYVEKAAVESGIRHACIAAGVSVSELAEGLGIHRRALFNYRRYPIEPRPGHKASLRQIGDALFEMGTISVRFEPDDLLAMWGPQR